MWDSVGHPAKTKLATAMASVHWIIQENQGDSNSVQRMVEALESDGHIPHLVWLTKSPDVPAIRDGAQFPCGSLGE
jgi:hypothetical protein